MNVLFTFKIFSRTVTVYKQYTAAILLRKTIGDFRKRMGCDVMTQKQINRETTTTDKDNNNNNKQWRF